MIDRDGILPVQLGWGKTMIFQHVDLETQKLINSSRSDSEKIRNFTGQLLNALNLFFAKDEAQLYFGAAFKPAGDLSCSLNTLYGNARGRLTIQLAAGVMEGRYVFEKSVVSEEGRDAWVPIWAIRIGRNGNVWLGDEGQTEIDVVNLGPQNLSVGSAARSLLYRVAVTPIFQ